MSDQETPARVARYLPELGVIVLGILLALSADAFWESRQERQREYQYLEALSAELQAADSVLRFIVRSDSVVMAERRVALRVLLSTGTPDPADSLWGHGLGVRFEEASFVTGTIATLVQTGDINLIRSQQLQLRVGDLYSVLENHKPRLRFIEELLLQNFAALVRLDAGGVRSLQQMRDSPDFVALTRNTQVFTGLRLDLHQQIALRVESLMASVESEMGR